MKVYKEVNSYSDFDFWSGARDTVKYLTAEEIEEIFSMLEDIYPEGMEETEVNDFFWFEDDTIAQWLGYSSFDEIMERGEQWKIGERNFPYFFYFILAFSFFKMKISVFLELKNSFLKMKIFDFFIFENGIFSFIVCILSHF